ncbi:NAD(+) synthase [Lutimonas vermicola]|uniref:NH(3)-dependent NAD(+) synthetase n=1 Tax=Lutimonas vermicola TaxID=414288 RepID=A0ABU9L0Z9_9FLAO
MNTEKVTNHIVNWLKDYAAQAGAKGFVVGVSGGIDSAVTSALCARTGLQVLCLEMPIHQAPSQVNRALNHIDWLKKIYSGVGMTQVNLTPVFDSLIKALPEVEDEEERFMSLANTRARLRMTSLYYFAALNGLLVAGTGNKVEDFGVGFYTKYGDGGVDLSPIADLMKSEVYALAEYMGINKEIIVAAPTDGLWGDDRTDEDQIGASYDELEWAMAAIEQGMDEGNLNKRQKQVLDIYNRLHKANMHKMVPIPVCEIPEDIKSDS